MKRSLLAAFLAFHAANALVHISSKERCISRGRRLEGSPSTSTSSTRLNAISSNGTNGKQGLGSLSDGTSALMLLNEARLLREQATAIQNELDAAKAERLRVEAEKVDGLIDALLFHATLSSSSSSSSSSQQLLLSEAQVAELLIQKRLSYDQVNQMFDRIVEMSQRPQSIDNCSPLLSLLLDAACQVDCLERKDNPNKRWNHRVERDLRRKLFALGYGIRVEDVESERRGRAVRAITGENVNSS